MKSIWSAKDKAWIMKETRKWIEFLWLEPLSMTYVFAEKKLEAKGIPEGFECNAMIENDFPYKHATLTVFPNFLTNDQDDRRKTIIHEVFHLLLDPIKKNRKANDDLFQQFIEQAVDHLMHIQWADRKRSQEADATIRKLRRENRALKRKKTQRKK